MAILTTTEGLQGAVRRLTAENEELKRQNEELATLSEDLRREIEAKDERLDELRADNAKLRQDNDRLSESIEIVQEQQTAAELYTNEIAIRIPTERKLLSIEIMFDEEETK